MTLRGSLMTLRLNLMTLRLNLMTLRLNLMTLRGSLHCVVHTCGIYLDFLSPWRVVHVKLRAGLKSFLFHCWEPAGNHCYACCDLGIEH
jgi:hypothetical protein